MDAVHVVVVVHLHMRRNLASRKPLVAIALHLQTTPRSARPTDDDVWSGLV